MSHCDDPFAVAVVVVVVVLWQFVRRLFVLSWLACERGCRKLLERGADDNITEYLAYHLIICTQAIVVQYAGSMLMLLHFLHVT